ncbi:hypothetical protein GF325_09400 [Candidatus Bathyarchaeota archaeon]|nr:hypothetical protein [Candidatus Bathyarchaeota archaeon]
MEEKPSKIKGTNNSASGQDSKKATGNTLPSSGEGVDNDEIKGFLKRTLELQQAHYSIINEGYQEKKDVINEFVLLGFDQVKTTVDATVETMKHQLASVNQIQAEMLIGEQEEVLELLNDARSSFQTSLKSLITGLLDGFSSFMENRHKSITLLLNHIEKEGQLNRFYATSEIVKLVESLARKVIDDPQHLMEKMEKESRNYYSATFDLLDSKVQEWKERFDYSMDEAKNEHENSINQFKQYLENSSNNVSKSIHEMLESTKNVISSKNGDMLDHIEGAKGRVNHHATELNEEITRHANQLDRHFRVFLKENTRIKDELKKDINGIQNVELRRNIEKILDLVDDIESKSTDFTRSVAKTTDRTTKRITNDIHSFEDGCDTAGKMVEKHATEAGKQLSKVNQSFLEEMTKKIEAMVKQEGFEKHLKHHRDSLANLERDFLTIVDRLREIEKSAMDSFTSGILGMISGIFSQLETKIHDGLSILKDSLDENGAESIERIKEITRNIAKENKEITIVPEDHFLSKLSDLTTSFNEHLVQLKDAYNYLFQKQHYQLSQSFDTMKEAITGQAKQYHDTQEVILDTIKEETKQVVHRVKDMMAEQLKEFNDRLAIDAQKLVEANQEVIGKMMVKSARTGNEFSTLMENTMKQSEEKVRKIIERCDSIPAQGGKQG